MNTIRRGLKRKEPEREEEYQAGLTQFQVRISKIYSQSVVSELGAKKITIITKFMIYGVKTYRNFNSKEGCPRSPCKL